MKDAWEYWKANILLAKSRHNVVVILIGFVATLIWPIFWIFGIQSSVENILLKIVSYIGFTTCIVWCLIWLPVKRNKEQKNDHNNVMGQLASQHAERIAEAESRLTNKIQILEKEKAEKSKVKITAEMRREAGQYQQKMVYVKILNGSNKIVRVAKVAIHLIPHKFSMGGTTIYRPETEMVFAQPKAGVNIEPDDGHHEWGTSIDDTVNQLKAERRDNKCFGQGYVEFINGHVETFEFETI